MQKPATRLTAFTLAAAAASASWSIAALYALYTPLLKASAPGFNAIVSLTWHHVEVLGRHLSVPALDRLSALLFPAAAAAVYTLLAALASLAALTISVARGGRGPQPSLIAPLYTASVVAVASSGPLTAAYRLAASILNDLIASWRGITNAGSITLYKPTVEVLSAAALLKGIPNLLTAIAAAAAALSALAAIEALPPAPHEEERPPAAQG